MNSEISESLRLRAFAVKSYCINYIQLMKADFKNQTKKNYQLQQHTLDLTLSLGEGRGEVSLLKKIKIISYHNWIKPLYS